MQGPHPLGLPETLTVARGKGDEVDVVARGDLLFF